MKNKKINIAIDGPSGSGKSTVAKKIAREFGFIYVDTGAIYRTVGVYVMEKGIGSRDADGIISALPEINIKMELEGGSGVIYLNGKKVGEEIRTPEASVYASDVSKIREVRDFLLGLQKNIAENHDAVMDGRDIGTVIMPEAQVKIFLSASPEARARRRHGDFVANGEDVTYEKVLESIVWRDKNDSEREVAPAVPAWDCVFVDNSELLPEETFEKIKKIITDRIF